MSDVLVLTDIVVKNQKIEGEHGNRIRLTLNICILLTPAEKPVQW